MPMVMEPEQAVRFESVGVTLGGVQVLNNITASVPRGGSTAIIGPNGAGKTTLILALLAHVPYEGRIHIPKLGDGRMPKIGYVPQKLTFDRGLPLTVLEFLAMGDQRMPFWFGVGRANRLHAVELLAAVHSEQLETRRIGALSGGELQRVLLALALQNKPDLLILDEPAAGVDCHGETLFCEVLESLREKWRFTQVMVSHDLSTVTHHATHVICLNREVVAEGTPEEVLTPETLGGLFGLHMGIGRVQTKPVGQSECSDCRCEGDHHA